jgi:16S rRNA processing protein RimM
VAGPRARVCVGAITGSHGVRGAVKLKSFMAAPEDIVGHGPVSDESGLRRFTLNLTGAAGDRLIARIDGVVDRAAAEALKGTQLFLPREALPAIEGEDEYYVEDLMGLQAELRDGSAYGEIVAVHDFGAGQVLEIAPANGPTVMFPFTVQAVSLVDVAAGRMVVDPPPGLVDGDTVTGDIGEE